MTRFHSSRPDQWTHPRRPLADWERRHHYGRLLPMDEPKRGILARLLGRG